METIPAIYDFLEASGWVRVADPETGINFLAAGEYNENYLVEVIGAEGLARCVFRINHGSQLGLDHQIGYEFHVLQALAWSGVTPQPFFCEPNPGMPELDRGVLLMEYLEGRPLDYERDWQSAAFIFARTHAQPVDDRLLVQEHPILDIATESEGLIRRFPDHPMTKERDLLLAYHDEILELAESAGPLFADDPLVMANTEVNSHNFIINDRAERGWLVDWEKAVSTSRFQDLGHFLVPTTTLWKTDFRFTEQGKRDFVARYLRESGLNMDLDTALRLTRIMERTILLRAMAWCYMAHYEYTRGDRALKNPDTFARIQFYLSEMTCFFESMA